MDNYKNPKITVLMPVYNCELYINEAVDSILNQTFDDFELLIIDDASTDKTTSIIKMYNDSRIKLIEKPLNTGLTNSLNQGLKLAKGKYIARMDGDDISLPERFAKQIALLETNPNVVLCGTLYQIIGTDKVCDHPLKHEEIKIKLISGCYIAHPTVMMRKETLELNDLKYNPNMEPAEDYDLWTKMIFLGKVVNLGEVLLYYRIHPQQTSLKRNEKQNEMSLQIRMRMLQKIMPNSSNEFHFFDVDDLTKKNNLFSKEFKERILFLNQLIKENNKKKVYATKLFSEYINLEKIFLCKLFYHNHNTIPVRIFVNILLNVPKLFVNIGLKESMKFIFKSFIYEIKKQ